MHFDGACKKSESEMPHYLAARRQGRHKPRGMDITGANLEPLVPRLSQWNRAIAT